jgi:hypothetical protein
METKLPRHPFSQTLGVGPYRLVDFFALILPTEENQGRNNFHLAPKNLKSICGRCAHCGHDIINNYIVQNGLGERFAVGSECVEKAGHSGEIENMSAFEKHQRQLKRQQSQERRERQRLALKEKLVALVMANSKKLDTIPFVTAHTKTAWDYCSWYIKRNHSLGGYKIFQKRLSDWGVK